MWAWLHGTWEWMPGKDPAALLIEAGPDIQRACVRQGGTNLYGKPNYRVVLASSRLQLAGDFDVNRKEGERVVPMGTCLLALPKHPRVMADAFILEFWKPPSFYAEHGREEIEIKWTHLGACRQLPPLPRQGDYEPVECGFDFPMMFFHRYTTLTMPNGQTWEAAPMTPQLIESAVRLHQVARSHSSDEKMSILKRVIEIEERQQLDRMGDVVDEAIGPFGIHPHSGFGHKSATDNSLFGD